MKLVLALIVLLLSWAMPFSSEAAFCRVLKNQTICIMDVQRSAKYHWEYRVAVSVDGVEQPIERYNCRDRVRVRKDGTVVQFEPEDWGNTVCRIVQPRSRR
ncbi:MAG TPA: hypothetical protein V6D10_22995 [Trichocoleus sp.]